MRSSRRKPRGLLAEDYALDINDPEQSRLSDDQLKIVYVATELDEMFRVAELRPSQRSLLLRLYEEVVVSGIDDQDRRFFRAAREIEERVTAIDARGEPRNVTSADALALLITLDRLNFDVHDRCADKLERVAALMALCRPRPRPKGTFGPAGVLARILFLAGRGVGSLEGFVSRVSSAATREAAREKKRRAL